MKDIIFESTLFFEILDFSVSHKVLLMRGTEIIEENEQYISHKNIDLLFGSVQFMQIPTIFEGGIIIKKGVTDKSIKIHESKRVLKANNYFEIYNDGIVYFIESYGVQILENDLDRAESSIDEKKYRTSPEEKSEKSITNIEDTKYKMGNVKRSIEEISIWESFDLKTKESYIKTMIYPFKYQEKTLNSLIDYGNSFHQAK